MRKKLTLFILVIYFLLYPPKNLYNYIINTNLFVDLFVKLFPSQTKLDICESLVDDIKKVIYPNTNDYSVSVANSNGKLIANINGTIPRIPASNQKLITTAFALDKLGPQRTLNTSLYKTSSGIYHIQGTGNPDLSAADISSMADYIIKTLPYNFNSTINLVIHEEPRKYWWPSSWSRHDRSKTYGSPITRLAIQSNSNSTSLYNPTIFLKQLISNDLYYNHGLKINFEINHLRREPDFSKIELLHSIKSAPLYALISLANSESHNFTSEVLLRNSLNTWDVKSFSNTVLNWLLYKRISASDFIVDDGSGLSRTNRVTSNGLIDLLLTMNNHRYSNYYFSSLSVYGVRGTLKNKPYNSNLDYKFYGKTGTLDGVRSISGILFDDNTEPSLFISIIGNNLLQSDQKVDQILLTISKNSCS